MGNRCSSNSYVTLRNSYTNQLIGKYREIYDTLLPCLQCGSNLYSHRNHIRKYVFEHEISCFYLRGNRGRGILLLSLHVCKCSISATVRYVFIYLLFFSIWVFFHNHSRITRLQVKGERISSTPHYHFHPLQRHLDISHAITAESSPLHISSSRTRTGNLWLSSENC